VLWSAFPGQYFVKKRHAFGHGVKQDTPGIGPRLHQDKARESTAAA
jgi:hypothetical protein